MTLTIIYAHGILNEIPSKKSILMNLLDFARCMFIESSPKEFELVWYDMVDKYAPHGNQWIEEIYVNRLRWAKAYISEGFFFFFFLASE